MDKRTTDIVAYLTWVGLLIALIFGDRENSKFHLNQALVIWLFGLLGVIPCIGWLWGIFCFVCANSFRPVSGISRFPSDDLRKLHLKG